MTSRFGNQKGFSLIELMVVVAIIGILAAVAVPNVLKFMAKARQAEVKTLLSGIYTAEKAFFAEYTGYHGNFSAVGFSPEGQLRYNAGFGAAGTPAGAANGYNGGVTGFSNTNSYCGAGAGTATNGCVVLLGATGAAPPALSAALIVDSSTGVFTAGGTAMIYKPVGGTAAVADIWTMDNNKILTNTVNGVP